ncbi:YtzH-like family protein [Robertmurraya sp. DFI.2.37]|uniref:YtzH-like family protein n=1 Tax=Robertmurraya sp. DFI.2.37 TaxID=3031819 RepID=UPI001245E940|nr:YtzH-like family protein [Robertmurraya sp. DFI.2.37]MDF1508679.1 YtzH-like family protein [Robertmurraya sp. DFI.2.37]
MPLNQQDQLQLLKDILSNHQVDCCGSIAELEQLERLVKSLMTDSNVDNEVLEQIYHYSQNGINSSNLDNHIESHQQQLSQWVNEVESFS